MSVFKSLVNLAATAGVAGVIAVSPIFTPKAEALTETQALERLARIPVFTITDDKGVPLTASIPPQPNAKPDDRQIWFFFLGSFPNHHRGSCRQYLEEGISSSDMLN